jgi:spore coat protein CotF
VTVKLTQKERSLLNDQKTHEQVCIAKYQDYANRSQDAQLKQLFTSLAQSEQEHLNSVNQMLSGQIPNVSQGQGQNQQPQQGQAQGGSQNTAQGTSGAATGGATGSTAAGGSQSNTAAGGSASPAAPGKHDASLCNDMLMTEKYVSGAYDTAIFEFTDSNARQVLNHIQKEEQQHGEQIFNYMQQNGLYNTTS